MVGLLQVEGKATLEPQVASCGPALFDGRVWAASRLQGRASLPSASQPLTQSLPSAVSSPSPWTRSRSRRVRLLQLRAQRPLPVPNSGRAPAKPQKPPPSGGSLQGRQARGPLPHVPWAEARVEARQGEGPPITPSSLLSRSESGGPSLAHVGPSPQSEERTHAWATSGTASAADGGPFWGEGGGRERSG